MKFKGVELPVNSVIVIALAIFVLLMMAAFFSGAGKNIDKTQLQTASSEACSILSTVYNCDSSKVGDATARVGNQQVSLRDICNQMGISPLDNNACVKVCAVCQSSSSFDCTIRGTGTSATCTCFDSTKSCTVTAEGTCSCS
ncbi:MAG: hypothetical protein JW727_05230 [Candidatus Aenigmarchaeota archaeon]|nr:hypothetical protein [Candidatus Aenigmarchaeota archaeon]